VEQYLEFIKDGFKAQAAEKAFLNDVKLLTQLSIYPTRLKNR